MSEENPVKSIEIVREIPFDGTGDTLFNRLRQVRLRGFPDLRIYKKAKFNVKGIWANDIPNEICTPQTRVYKNPNLERIARLDELFLEKGIDITLLGSAYDYIASDSEGNETEWTIMPPIAERFRIPFTEDGNLDYTKMIGKRLQRALNEKGVGMNPELVGMSHPGNEDGEVVLINDGSHRIHYGHKKGHVINILIAERMVKGYPYYAAPQDYNVTEFATRDEAVNLPETKVHIVESPAHKDLYRLFPSGGIMCGGVRSDKKLKN